MPVDAFLFDKDGTLFDFAATWNGWAARVLETLAKGDRAVLEAMAEVISYDLERQAFNPDSLVIAGSNDEVAEVLAPFVADMGVEELLVFLALSAAEAELAPAVPLAAFLDSLLARGKVLGVMTNDAENSARSQLERAGVLDRFAFVAGCDSGHGAKPAPDPLLAFCKAAGVAPGRTAMVGDSRHDLEAGAAAGMLRIGVLTGLALRDELTPHADIVLPDIGHIPAWMDR
ncbi:HAD family hydrolase [Leisingera methylohalidivorans]|uniref:phosphoglycolate phosphatase n=1 Tax=Leisingera methylohalidivorans DSM 14336 TaxID=999552 RepID=V9VUY1_9RHOB|nr:HAD family hydrolase [Leisingera methylohalidivorans]AHD01519.1 phosphatase [Leisingera methylohalidivorans DSM 14336]